MSSVPPPPEPGSTPHGEPVYPSYQPPVPGGGRGGGEHGSYPPPPPPWAQPPHPSTGAGPGVPPTHQQRSRRGGWVPPVLLIVVGIAVGVFLVVRAVLGFSQTEATVPADGEPHAVTLADTGERMVWVEEYTTSSCTIVEQGGDTPVQTRSMTGRFTKSGPSGSWVGSSTFDPPGTRLEVTCAAGGGAVQIGPAVDGGGFALGIVLGILVPLLSIAVGVVWLVVRGVRGRRTRQHPWT